FELFVGAPPLLFVIAHCAQQVPQAMAVGLHRTVDASFEVAKKRHTGAILRRRDRPATSRMMSPIVVQSFLEEQRRAEGAFEVPLAMRRHMLLVQRPGVERVVAERAGQLAGVHRYVAGPRWNRAGFDS